ncbi:Pisatin demethylase [Pyrenophora seminiperda CCB06]|uniref:Pisatin demethylase n=1 Tax=Pyrenophora seminiperda CCB06 TaxID=1302712 RepID=A0A3M7MC79_9PLEO|nr:Pisatin demethylase [Pyrenophora seminiperda CCB06]
MKYHDFCFFSSERAKFIVFSVMTINLHEWAYATAYVTFGVGILSSIARKFRTFVYVGFALIFCVFLSSLWVVNEVQHITNEIHRLMTVLQCIPFEKILNPALHPEVKCIDARTIMLTPPVLNIFTDFYIIFLPMPTIWYLQMNRRRKATVITVLAFGVLSTTVAILRLPVLISVTLMKTDASIDVGKMIIVASFQVQCAIIAVNLPATKSLWTKIRGRYNPEDSDNLQEPFGLSPVGRKRRGDTNGTSNMGTVTRLERGLTASESKEELFQEPDRQARWTTRSVACSVSGDGELKRKQSICVTTSVDIEHSPRVSSQQEPLPPPLPHVPLPHTLGHECRVITGSGTAKPAIGPSFEINGPLRPTNPQRWLDDKDIAEKEKKYWIPVRRPIFSVPSRFGAGYGSCPGQNIAKIELSKLAATIIRDYNIRPEYAGQEWKWKAYFTVVPHSWRVFVEKTDVR